MKAKRGTDSKKIVDDRLPGKWERVGRDLILRGWFNGKKMTFTVPPGDDDALLEVVDAKVAEPFRAKRKKR